MNVPYLSIPSWLRDLLSLPMNNTINASFTANTAIDNIDIGEEPLAVEVQGTTVRTFEFDLLSHLPQPIVFQETKTEGGTIYTRGIIDVAKSAYGVKINVTSFDPKLTDWRYFTQPYRKFGSISLQRQTTVLDYSYINFEHSLALYQPSLTLALANMVALTSDGTTAYASEIGIQNVSGVLGAGVNITLQPLWIYDRYTINFTESSPASVDYTGKSCAELIAAYSASGHSHFSEMGDSWLAAYSAGNCGE